MRYHHPYYMDLPLPVHADGPERTTHRTRHRHWLLILMLILLAVLLIGVTVTGGGS